MKANELMIGDWVYVSKNFTQKYHKIRALSNDEGAVLRGMYVNEYGVENNSVFSPNDTEPIPLTPEVLEKNGFIKSEDPILMGGIGCAIIYGGYKRLDEDKFLNYGDNIYPIRYVHQLQHALRLCGIEKEIIL